MKLKQDKTYIDTWTTRENQFKLGGFNGYGEFLKSENWKIIKEKQSNRVHLQECYLCSSTEDIDLHHNTYKHLNDDKNALRSIRACCRYHHNEIHELAKIKQISVGRATKMVRKKWKKYNIMAFQRRYIKENPFRDWSKLLKGRPIEPNFEY